MSHHGLIAHFFMLNNISFSGITTVYSSTHLLEGQLGCCQVLAVMNKAAINICVQVFVWTLSFQLIWVNTRNEVAGSCGKSMYSSVKNYQTVFHTILHSHQ